MNRIELKEAAIGWLSQKDFNVALTLSFNRKISSDIAWNISDDFDAEINRRITGNISTRRYLERPDH